jgi:hypothetical protein
VRYRTIVLLLCALVAVPTAAMAKGPSGSREKKNQVKCGKGTATPAGTAYAGTDGAELCSGDSTPPDGRIVVTPGYVAVDGDKSNGGEADGFVRVDQGGPTCENAKKTDSGKRGASCQPAAP